MVVLVKLTVREGFWGTVFTAGDRALIRWGQAPTATHRNWPPQQVTVPSVRIAQVCWDPALTDVKEPAGCSSQADSWPQQTSVPSVRTPQLWPPPAVTEVNEPTGRLVW